MISSPELPDTDQLTPEQQLERDIATVLKSALDQHHAGEFADAEALYRAILEAMPGHADVLYNLGVLLGQTQRVDEAVLVFEQALGVAPQNGQFWVSYIDALARTGQSQAAWFAVEMAQQRGVRGPAMNALVERLSNPKGYAAAVIAEAVYHAAANAPKQVAEAETVSKPTSANGRKGPTPQEMNQFASLFNKGRHVDAERLTAGLVRRAPDNFTANRAHGLVLYTLGRYIESVAPLQKVMEQQPDDAEAGVLLASALDVKGDHAAAERQCRLLLAIYPDNAEAWRTLGVTLTGMRRMIEGIDACSRAVELAPNRGSTHSALGVALLDDGQIGRAEESFRNALKYDPLDFVSHSNLLFCLTHSVDITPAQLFEEHREFGRRHEARIGGRPAPHANAKRHDKRLRIGLVSGDLFRHAVTTFLEPVLQHLQHDSSLELHAYSNFAREDHATERLRGYIAKWHAITGLSDDALAKQIRADGIDILIDLSGHTGRNRLLMFARKAAPLQATWIGYPNTTGMAAVDYFFTNRMPNFPSVADQFIEKLAFLPAASPFLPDAKSPPVNALPALHKGYVTFGSFNRMSKLRREVIALWARLLRALPDSRMFMGAMPDDSSLDELLGWFDAEGIARERIELAKRSGMAVYLQQHHQVDICLDTFPYAGGTTTLHALWMGVPTLTLLGDTMPGRVGGSLMSQVGLDSFIARDADEFVEKGIAFASDLPALTKMRIEMRERCRQSARFNPDVIAASMSRALRHMWHRHCDGLPPESFDTTLLADARSEAPAI